MFRTQQLAVVSINFSQAGLPDKLEELELETQNEESLNANYRQKMLGKLHAFKSVLAEYAV